MGIGANLSQGYSTGGSSSVNASQANNFANSFSNTAGAAASQFSAEQAALARTFSAAEAEKNRQFNAEQAAIARQWQEAMFAKEMEYNSAEALKAREWNQANIDTANKMADTVYTRSVNDMRKAGINPILAASFGLGAAGSGSVTSGAGAAASAPSGAMANGSMAQGFMGQGIAEQNSASHSEGQSESWGRGSSWQNSENGLATFLDTVGKWIEGLTDAIQSGKVVESASKTVEEVFEKGQQNPIVQGINKVLYNVGNKIDTIFNKKGKKGDGGGAW